LDALWPGVHVTPAALSAAIQRARQAVGDDGEHQAVLQTEHGKGFRFVAEVIDLSPPETAEPAQELALPTPETDRPGPTGAAQSSLIAELKRRNVFRVAVAYGIVGWLLVEIASVVLPTFDAPNWVMKVITFLVILGFPPALVLAWAFELTPEGIKREAAVDPAESITQRTGRKLDFAIIALLALAVVFLGVEHYVLEANPEQTTVAVETAEPGKSIAVLPFVNMSSDPDQEYFADGISEELLNTLAQFEDLRVVGRTSSFSFRKSDANLTEIGEALNADVILEGSVRKAGDRVRITAQLNNAKSGFHIWSEVYERELTDIFAIQTEIATAITGELRVNLSSEERERLARSPTQNLEAYQAYLQGKRHLVSEETVESIKLFEKAIDLDPEFALAYVGLADSFMVEDDSAGFLRMAVLERAQAMANTALAIDAGLGDAHAVLAHILWLETDFEGAAAAYQRAVTLGPSSQRAFFEYGSLLFFKFGRYEEALALTKRAVELDPLSAEPIQLAGEILRALGRLEESQRWHELALEIDPDFAGVYFGVMAHHWFDTGRIDEAIISHRKGLIIDPNAWSYAIYGWLWLELGDPDEAEHWISRAYEMDPEQYYAVGALQALAIFRGDDAAARVYGNKAYEIRPRDELSLTFLRDRKVREGRYEEARALYEEHYPELVIEGNPRVEQSNVRHAIDLALVLDRAGDQEQAELLRDRCLEELRGVPRAGIRGSFYFDAFIHAQRGEKQKALSALREAIDAGVRGAWWWEFDKPEMELLHDEPEFQAIFAQIKADIAAQLARVRELERNGELEPIPEISLTTQ
ncbi:MAG: tetratricopeptide repeat protein, partial [Deltaproteobacteria bacterium]|nr:tetratricopeptide repeat protein [Deltaproteobacteria bacterium]